MDAYENVQAAYTVQYIGSQDLMEVRLKMLFIFVMAF